jgi:hypothetical protein
MKKKRKPTSEWKALVHLFFPGVSGKFIKQFEKILEIEMKKLLVWQFVFGPAQWLGLLIVVKERVPLLFSFHVFNTATVKVRTSTTFSTLRQYLPNNVRLAYFFKCTKEGRTYIFTVYGKKNHNLHTFFPFCRKQPGSGSSQPHRHYVGKLFCAKNRTKSSMTGLIYGKWRCLFFPPHFVINLSLQTCNVLKILIFLGEVFIFT